MNQEEQEGKEYARRACQEFIRALPHSYRFALDSLARGEGMPLEKLLATWIAAGFERTQRRQEWNTYSAEQQRLARKAHRPTSQNRQ